MEKAYTYFFIVNIGIDIRKTKKTRIFDKKLISNINI